MNAFFIQAANREEYVRRTQIIQRLASLQRLEHSSLPFEKLETLVQSALNAGHGTFVAFGDDQWYAQLISLACKLRGQRQLPVFSHISVPGLPSQALRLALVHDRLLKPSFRALAARKLAKNVIFNCANTVWFRDKLTLSRKDTSGGSTKLTLSTSGGRITVEAEFDRLTFTSDYGIEQQSPRLLLSAERQRLNRRQTGDSLLPNISRQVQELGFEDICHAPIITASFVAHQPFLAVDYDVPISGLIEVRQAAFSILSIAYKNDIRKY